MSNTVYGKTMANLRHKIDVKFVSNKKNFLKWTSKLSYMSQKTFDNNLAVIRKSKIILTLKKPAYLRCVY